MGAPRELSLSPLICSAKTEAMTDILQSGVFYTTCVSCPQVTSKIRVHGVFRDRTICPQALKTMIASFPALNQSKVSIFIDTCIVDGYPAVTMRHYRQGNIVEHIARNLARGVKESLIFEATCALRYLHSRNIFHGNLHPGNTLVDNCGKVVLVDVQFRYYLVQIGVIPEGRLPENVRYLAPEAIQACEGFQPTPSADVYSLACVIYHVLSGQVPFHRNKIATSVAVRIVNETHAALPKSDNIPKEVWTILTECWNVDPNARPTAFQVMERLHEIV